MGIVGNHTYQVIYTYYPPAYQQPASPIVIDTVGDGFALTSAYQGVSFDFTGTGLPIPAAWTQRGSDDAFLALDRNGNGRIDNGQELFGNFTPQPESANRNGFIALSGYDSNSDGVIDRRDAVFTSLRLWRDTNHNGVSEPLELSTLPTLGVAALGLDYSESPRTDGHGNQFKYRARVLNSRGEQLGRWSWDVFFQEAPFGYSAEQAQARGAFTPGTFRDQPRAASMALPLAQQ